MQTSYNADFEVAQEGQLEDVMTAKTESMIAVQQIPVGRFVYRTADGKIRLPNLSATKLVLDANLVSGNTIAGNIVIVDTNTGLQTAFAYSETYATTHLDTMNALAAQLAGVAGVANATVSGPTNLEINVTALDGYGVFFQSGIVTGGTTQPNVDLVAFENGMPWGFVYSTQREPDSDGSTVYQSGECVPVAVRGDFWVRSDAALNYNSTVYVRVYHDISNEFQQRGMLTNSPGANPVRAVKLPGAVVLKPCQAGGLAKIRINYP